MLSNTIPYYKMEIIALFSKYVCLLIVFSFCIANFAEAYTTPACLVDQKQLLLQLRSELVFNSSVSTRLVSWNTANDCCTWSGVECDAHGHVTALLLHNETISGEIDDSSILFNFRHLQKLNLAYNDFGGCNIPSAIHNLVHLTHLNLSNANFSGQLPLSLSLIVSLVSLDLSFSPYPHYYYDYYYYYSFYDRPKLLTIENPNLESIIGNLTGLRELYLDGVNISSQGQMGEWGYTISSSLPELRVLSLRRCGLSGPLHSSILQLHHLSILQLDHNQLSIIFPDFLVNFSKLTTLTLRNCSLIGPFPEMIFQLPTLEYLDLSMNRNLSGTLPQFPPIRSLRTIIISDTNFSGPLPNSISNLQMLSHLDLSRNSFSGAIPSFYKLRRLSHIDLHGNTLTGTLSSMDFRGNTNLVSLDLSSNFLSGNIPRTLFEVPSLETLYLSNNHFNGTVNEFSNIHSSNLERVDLSYNGLEGSIPKSFFKLQRLNYLDLSHNSFNGSVNFGSSTSGLLRWLDISYNNLSIDASCINSSMSAFAHLYSLNLASCNLQKFPDLRNHSLIILDLSNNQIAGQIPSWIWELGNGILYYLNLSFNMLVDFQKPYHFPPEIYYLNLQSNQLKGQLPSFPLKGREVDYSNNKFQGSLPFENFTQHFDFLSRLNLSHNALTGAIPTSLFNLTELTILDLSNNLLTGEIPSVGNFIPIRFLSITNNDVSGKIPSSLCNATDLAVLDLSDNNLSDTIPSCLMKDLVNLQVLNLATNNISGGIPDSFSRECELQTLDLRKNRLKGCIPLSLANCKSLEVMNVGSNMIEDGFPCMIPASLRVLVLHSNKFHGEVRCNKSWPNLQIIDIASNNFNGYLHQVNFNWIGMMQNTRLDSSFISHTSYYNEKVTLTFKGLELEFTRILTIFGSIDFSRNNFQGEIPDAVGNLKSLYVLNLSHNVLTGAIPNSFGKLSELESLDLSNNMLTGEIPRELALLTSLSVLYLSYNKLVGIIPKGPQFQTFSASSFQGNEGLCGFPLENCSKTDENGESVGGDHSSEKGGIEWAYVWAVVGFSVAFGSVVWLLFACESINIRFCEKADEIFEYIFINSKNKRRRQRSRVKKQDQVRRH